MRGKDLKNLGLEQDIKMCLSRLKDRQRRALVAMRWLRLAAVRRVLPEGSRLLLLWDQVRRVRAEAEDLHSVGEASAVAGDQVGR